MSSFSYLPAVMNKNSMSALNVYDILLLCVCVCVCVCACVCVCGGRDLDLRHILYTERS